MSFIVLDDNIYAVVISVENTIKMSFLTIKMSFLTIKMSFLKITTSPPALTGRGFQRFVIALKNV
jgi:hypothetical protein